MIFIFISYITNNNLLLLNYCIKWNSFAQKIFATYNASKFLTHLNLICSIKWAVGTHRFWLARLASLAVRKVRNWY